MALHRGRKGYPLQFNAEENDLSDVDTIDIMIPGSPGSPQSDGGKSDDTEYLLGANVSVRDMSFRDISFRDFGQHEEQEVVPVKMSGHVKKQTFDNPVRSKIPKQQRVENRHVSREITRGRYEENGKKYEGETSGDKISSRLSPQYKSKELIKDTDYYQNKRAVSPSKGRVDEYEVKEHSTSRGKRKSSERKKREDLRSMGVEFSDDDEFDVDKVHFVGEQKYDISPLSEDGDADMISDILSDIDFGMEAEQVKKNLFGGNNWDDYQGLSRSKVQNKLKLEQELNDSEDDEILISISQRDIDFKGGKTQGKKQAKDRRDFDHDIDDYENHEEDVYKQMQHRSPDRYIERSPEKHSSRRSPDRNTSQQSVHGLRERHSPLRAVDQNSPHSSLEGPSPERSHERHRSKRSPDKYSPHRKHKTSRSPDKRANLGDLEREHGDSFSPSKQGKTSRRKHQQDDSRADSKGSSTLGSHHVSMESQHKDNESIEEELKKRNLALNVDPQTNEVYDDKVKEGADLVAKLLGTDFQKMYSPQSNTSKDSNTADKKDISKQHSNDNSKEHPQTEAFSQEEIVSEPQQRSVRIQDLRQDSSERKETEDFMSAPLRNSVLERAASEPQQNGFKTSTPHHKKELNPEPNVKKVGSEFHTDFYIERQAELQKKVMEMDRRLREDVTKLRDIELDIDEANSKKKLILHDVKVLEDTLNRNRSESQSCENLMEEYRRQATKARSELLDLERQRDKLHHEVMASKERKEGEATERVIEVEHLGMAKKELFALLRERDELRGELDVLRSHMNEERVKFDSEKVRTESQVKSLEDQVSQLYKQLDEGRERYHKMREERNSELEALQDKMWKEHEQLSHTIEEQQFKLTKQDSELRKNDEEMKTLMTELKQQKQHFYESEKQWKETVDSEKAKYREQSSFSDEKEVMFLSRQKDLEQMLEQRTLQNKILEERTSAQVDELQNIIKDKDEEIAMMKGLIRQQEDATRNLGDRLRNESQEQLRNALSKERDSMEHEVQKHKSRLTDLQEKFEKQVNQMKEELEKERKSHKQTQSTVTRLKQEMDQLREENVNANEERIRAVNKARNENREEFTKIKEKLQQVSLQTDKLEKDAVKEIYEECNKIASMTGSSPLKFSPARNGVGLKTGSPTIIANGSLIKNALSRLCSLNEELRQYFQDLRKENKKHKQEMSRVEMMTNAGQNSSKQEIIQLKNQLRTKEEELALTHRHHHEELHKLTLQVKADNSSIGDIDLMSSSVNSSPSKTGEDSHTTKLLKHLQGRVKQLRSDNESLRNISEGENSLRGDKLADDLEDEISPDIQRKIGKLQAAAKISEEKAHKNASLLSQKMMEMTKLQKMLTHSTKENMKLEREYAELQRKMTESSR